MSVATATTVTEIVIDPTARDVRVGHEPVRLTRREFDLLLYFVRHAGIAFTRLQLLRSVWGHEFSGERTVDVHIRRLRAKLGEHSNQLTTLHGYGYRFDPAPTLSLKPTPPFPH